MRRLERSAAMLAALAVGIGLIAGAGPESRAADRLKDVQEAIQDEQADIYDPVQRGVIKWEQLLEIGEILAGKKEGRTKAEQVTFYKNNAGQGVADVALGALVLEQVRKKGSGQTLKV